ncbi:MAG: hypothetical protein Fur005_11210 [Roseiflexaceae bacterium]
MTQQPVDWANRWIGGFCAVAAIGGLPVRGQEYRAPLPLAQQLVLEDDLPLGSIEQADVEAIWSAALGGAHAILVRSADHARSLVLRAAGVVAGEYVGVPANGNRDLVESVKHYGAKPAFLALDQQLAPTAESVQAAGVRYSWAQPIMGVGGCGAATWLDCSDTLPSFMDIGSSPVIRLYGLHLSHNQQQAGALVICTDTAMAQALRQHQRAGDQPLNSARALARLRQLQGEANATGLLQRQHTTLAEVWRGLNEAAGLELLPSNGQSNTAALAGHILVRIPDESDPATFYAYVKAEQTPVHWLAEERPLHYAAVREMGRHAATAAELARWLIVPVGPDEHAESIKHAVLGVVKAAEYLGVRWYTNPAYAAEYAAMMDELYGADHDAYRPIFPTPAYADAVSNRR